MRALRADTIKKIILTRRTTLELAAIRVYQDGDT